MSNVLTQGEKPVSTITHVYRGEIYFANIGGGQGSEQSGTRPVIILQNNVGNRFSPTTIVAVITTSFKKDNLPVHFAISKDVSNLDEDSVILFEQIKTIDKRRLLRKVNKLSEDYMKQYVDPKVLISLGIHPDFSK